MLGQKTPAPHPASQMHIRTHKGNRHPVVQMKSLLWREGCGLSSVLSSCVASGPPKVKRAMPVP